MSKFRSGEISDAQAFEMLKADDFDYEVPYLDLEMYFETLGRTIISTACEDYFEAHYSDVEMTYDEWEALMDKECAQHPEWADEENL